MTAASIKPFRINVYGHVCGDYSTPIMRLSREQAAASQKSVLGIPDLERGKLMTTQQLAERGLTIADVCKQNGWETAKLGFSKGGPAASAALAAFQLASNQGSVHFYGAAGKDHIAERLGQYLDRYNLPHTLTAVRNAHTSHTLVVNEQVEGDADAQRTFIHEPGANAEVEIFPESVLQVLENTRNIFMVGGSFLMPKFHPQGVLRMFQHVKEQAAHMREADVITILNTVHDPSGNWDLGENAAGLIDVLIMDLDEAKGIAGMDVSEMNMPALFEWFKNSGFRNIVVTNGVKGAYMHSTDDNVFVPTPQHLAMHIPASRYVMGLDRPKYGLGCGDVTAGALAVAIGEHMDLVSAGSFAMSAGGACALVEPGEIGGPCKQGGQRIREGKGSQPTTFEKVLARMADQFDPGPRIMAPYIKGVDYEAAARTALEQPVENPLTKAPETAPESTEEQA